MREAGREGERKDVFCDIANGVQVVRLSVQKSQQNSCIPGGLWLPHFAGKPFLRRTLLHVYIHIYIM